MLRYVPAKGEAMNINKNRRVETRISNNSNKYQNQKVKDQAIVFVSGNKQVTLYILNIFFLLIITFISGYNLKGYQIQKSANASIIAAGQYIQNAEESRLKTLAVIEELKKYEIRHYQGDVLEKGIVNAISDDNVAETRIQIPAVADEKRSTGAQSEVKQFKKEQIKAIVPENIQVRKTLKRNTPPVAGVSIFHTVKKGEILSMLVRKAHIDYFLATNPDISNPDLIHTGQKLRILIPNQNIRTGSYMNNYFIQPAELNGNLTYSLAKWIIIPKSDSMLGYIIKQPKIIINRATTPYINLIEFTNTMKDEIFNEKLTTFKGKNKIGKVKKSHSGIYFQTLKEHPTFVENHYSGIHESNDSDFNKNIYMLKKYLIKYLVYISLNKSKEDLFHFMIFDRTIVQTDYLENKFINKNGDKSKIMIGLVYHTDKTEQALYELQSTITNCKAETGEIVEVDMNNIFRFQKF